MKKIFTGKSLKFLNDNEAQNRYDYVNRPHLGSADLEAEAAGLSNYTGGAPGGYLGIGDPFLSFAGDAGSFADPLARGKVYTITLINTNANPRYAIIGSGGLLYTNAAGLATDGDFNDTGGNAGLTGSGQPNALIYFNAFLHNYPTIVSAFRVTTTNVAQFDQVITVQKQSPFNTEATRIIDVGAYVDPINPNTSLVLVESSFYLDNQTILLYGVLGNTTVVIKLFMGASLNIAEALYAKATTAKVNMDRLGVQPQSNFYGRR
jgi:hypothetical protein